MREEEECDPGCYRHIYFLDECYRRIMRRECRRFNADEVDENYDLDNQPAS